MRAINHALTGSLIGLIVGQPAIALPAALASHFVCDIIPHHANKKPNSTKWLGSQRFRNILIADALLCIALVVALAVFHPAHWMLAATCAFLAASPDMMYIPRFLAARAKRSVKLNRLVRLSIDIQWFQRPIGWVVEVAWFAGAVVLLTPLLK